MELTNFQKNEKSFVKFNLRFSAEEYQIHLNKVSLEMQKTRSVDGYRTGKVPLGIAKNVFGHELFRQANTIALNSVLDDICLEHNIAPVSQPNIVVIRADLDGFEAMINFYSYPVLDSLDYKSLKVEKYVKTCSEEDIDAAIHQYMLNHRLVHEVQREAQPGDIVDVAFTGTCKGEPFPFNSAKNMRWTLGSDQLFAGLDEVLVGCSAGDDLDLTLTMPSDFHREDIAGLTLDLKVHLNSVSVRELLECTDEYVREHVNGCQSLAEFRELHRQNIQKQYDGKSNRLYTQALNDALAAAVTCHIPEPMVGMCLDQMMLSLQSAAAAEGLSGAEALEKVGKTVDDYMRESQPIAEKQVRFSVALDYIAQNENISITPDEVNNIITNTAKANGISFEEARTQRGGIEAVIEDLLNKKALDLVRSTVEPILVPVDKFPDE